MVAESFLIEDILVNEKNSNRKFTTSMPINRNFIFTKLCTPTIGEYFHLKSRKIFFMRN
jgi:hypothetical protein